MNYGRIHANSLWVQSAGSPSINIVLEDPAGLRWSGSLEDGSYVVLSGSLKDASILAL